MGEQTAIITGAASGIGLCFAGELLRRRPSMRLILADRDGASLAESFRESDTVTLETLDIRSLEQWQHLVDRAVARSGPIDYLFNIAGIDRSAMFIDQPLSNIDELIDINLKGTLYGMRIVAEQMAARRSGHIINIASLAGIAPTPGTADLLGDEVRAAGAVAGDSGRAAPPRGLRRRSSARISSTPRCSNSTSRTRTRSPSR